MSVTLVAFKGFKLTIGLHERMAEQVGPAEWSTIRFPLMLDVMTEAATTRPLTEQERRLARWMLEHGSPEAAHFIEQLDHAEATSWRCVCGCASFNFKVAGRTEAPPGVNILGDYLVGTGDDTFGVFIFQSEGVLSGVEVYSLAADAPSELPEPDQLRPSDFKTSEYRASSRDDA